VEALALFSRILCWRRRSLSYWRGERAFGQTKNSYKLCFSSNFLLHRKVRELWGAVERLKEIFVKKPNKIFARHKLATTCQQGGGKSLDDFLQCLMRHSKECEWRDVTAKQYEEDLVRDAFITGLASPAIRQRLLENKFRLDDCSQPSSRSWRSSSQFSGIRFVKSRCGLRYRWCPVH